MNTTTADVYILLSREDARTGITPVIDALGKIAGVHKVRTNKRVSALLAVEYDPACTGNKAILASARDRGYRASLIGM